ncbi:MAG TPA: DUF1572 family protein [Pyrinomonadaceae bacterium]|jgi:hypothetical protein|nr:DUF1572 family protein [Pyrinomonadaceae bacterium]
MSNESIGAHFLEDALKSFRDYKKLAEHAFDQIDEADLFRTIDEESNSVAVNMKHMAGNMLSRWTDFLTSDGEKPNRNRDMEFVMLPDTTKADMISYWDKGWQCTFDAIEPLRAEDLMRTITIRGQDHTVVQAINRQIAHYAYHVGQIVFLAKHFKASAWQTLSVPKNRSAEFNKYLEEKIKNADTAREDRFDVAAQFAEKQKKSAAD